MKKQMAATLAAAFVLGVAGTSFAASNPFVDVPAKHWSYDAVSKLAKSGIVDGYGDGTFKGDKTITRYEMAQIVAKAMANQEKATAAQKAEINKLQAEYADELDKLGVRVTNLEKKVGTLKVTGDARIRYQHNASLDGRDNGTVADANRVQERVRVSVTSQFDDNWTFNGRFGAQNTSNKNTGANAGNTSNNGEFGFDRMEFAYKNGTMYGSVGRSSAFIGQGAMYDASFDGVTLGNVFGKLNAKAYVGDAAVAGSVFKNVDPAPTANFNALDLNYAFDKNTSMTATYYKVDNNNYAFKFDGYLIGAKTTMGLFTLQAEYAKNNKDITNAQDKGYWGQVIYQMADTSKPGSYDIFVRYYNMGKDSVDGNTTTFDYMTNTFGIKGFQYGVDYVFAKGAKLQVYAAQFKPYDQDVTGHNFKFNNAYSAVATFNF